MQVRTTLLEAFRRLVETEYGDQSELIEKIQLGQYEDDPGSWQMQAGTAWHLALADPNLAAGAWGKHPDDIQQFADVQIGEFSFSREVIAFGQRHQGQGYREVPASKTYDILGHGRVTVTGTADLVQGVTIRDAKTKFSTADIRDYERSLQWRFYLDLFEAEKFTYDLFNFRDPKGGFCFLTSVQSASFFRYTGLERDCRYWVGQFVAWAKSKGLTEHLTPVKVLIAT